MEREIKMGKIKIGSAKGGEATNSILPFINHIPMTVACEDDLIYAYTPFPDEMLKIIRFLEYKRLGLFTPIAEPYRGLRTEIKSEIFHRLQPIIENNKAANTEMTFEKFRDLFDKIPNKYRPRLDLKIPNLTGIEPEQPFNFKIPVDLFAFAKVQLREKYSNLEPKQLDEIAERLQQFRKSVRQSTFKDEVLNNKKSPND